MVCYLNSLSPYLGFVLYTKREKIKTSMENSWKQIKGTDWLTTGIDATLPSLQTPFLNKITLKKNPVSGQVYEIEF